MIRARAAAVCTLLLVFQLTIFGQPAFSQQTPAEGAVDFDPAEWQALTEKKEAIVKQINEISAAFRTADQEQKKELVGKAQKIQREFQTQITPRMVELAPTAFERNPKDVNAAEIMLQLAYGKNQFERAAEIADGILAQQADHPLALNIGGVGQFAMHNFEKSLEMFETAKQKGVLYPQLGGQYLESARNYVDYWKTEQEIRQYEAAATGDEQLPRVMMKTDKGDILLELFENEAPNTVANFVSLVESKYYDGIPFHRVIPAFMAQGGMQPDPAKAVDYTIKCECYQDNARRHFTGSLSMAKTQQRDSGSTQFFLTHLPTPHLDKEINPESVHTVFGRVVEGMDAVAAIEEGDKIVSAEVVRKRNHEYKPVRQPPGE